MSLKKCLVVSTSVLNMFLLQSLKIGIRRVRLLQKPPSSSHRAQLIRQCLNSDF